jgi:hypothetical protein
MVDMKGEALITYRSGGKLKHVLGSGAVNALAPTAGARQVAFTLDYTGGYGTYRKADQSWQRGLPDYGATPSSAQAAWELRLSHWQGSLAQFDVRLDWAFRKYQHLYG